MTRTSGLTRQQLDVAQAIAEISRLGPVEAVGSGATAIGRTLLQHLGVRQRTTTKPRFKGVVLTAQRKGAGVVTNRVNLFAMVPDWRISARKSTYEIVERYGYERDGGRKLYVTVRTRTPNSQGLYLELDRTHGLLHERFRLNNGSFEEVATWRLGALRSRLLDRHPASAWITANVTHRGGKEMFHYRFVQFTGQPRDDMLPVLLEHGTITLDHLILFKDGKTVEKGPLFKIKPENIRSLFPQTPKVDLMSL